jgi:hypothetical protein
VSPTAAFQTNRDPSSTPLNLDVQLFTTIPRRLDLKEVLKEMMQGPWKKQLTSAPSSKAASVISTRTGS